MRKKISLCLVMVMLSLVLGCNVSINDEEVYDSPPQNDVHTTICGVNMIFYRERNEDVHEYYWGQVKIQNTYDQNAHVILSRGQNQFLDIYIGPVREYTYDIYIVVDTDVNAQIWHNDGWEWYTCADNGTILEL